MTDSLIELCFRQQRPFAMVVEPGMSWTDAHWYAPECDATEADAAPSVFAVRPFCLSPDSPLVRLHQTTPEALYSDRLGGGMSSPRPATEISTPESAYRTQARAIIDSLRERGGKIVLSRLVTVRSERPVDEVIREYFEHFPNTLRYVYLCDQTGLWFGASPELLIDYDATTGQLHTMSLAGTRKVSAEQPWDAKNLMEHQYVTDYILDCLHRHGLDPEITDSTPLRFGEIEHLCDRIAAIGEVDPVALADTLSPTPALCGYPKERAYRQILDTELHPRLYYGGWVAIRQGSRFLAHVNLRCARIIPTSVSSSRHGARRVSAEGEPLLYALYVGGGLTADSDIDTELAETQAKAKTLMNCITRNGEY